MSSRPFLLDLFCGAGGAAEGYHRAGFEVVGVDSKPQPRYPYRFICADALEYLAEWGQCYHAIHASPPCQKFCALRSVQKDKAAYDTKHLDLIEPTRKLLQATGRPYVIENVVGAPLQDAVLLCGSMFGLQTECGAQLRRHRLFETNWLVLAPPRCVHANRTIGVYGTGMAQEGKRTISVHGHCQLIEDRRTIGVYGHSARDGAYQTITVTGSTPQTNVVRKEIRKTYSVAQARQAMGIGWMTQAELSQAIPPAYTEFLGRQLILHIERRPTLTETEIKPLVELLPCSMTDDEITTKAREVSRGVRELLGLQVEKKDMMADYAQRIKDKSEELDRESMSVETGIETRPVTLSPRVNRRELKVEWIRCDTGEVQKTKRISREELEMLDESEALR